MQKPIPGLEMPYKGPQTDEDWFAKRFELGQLFSPTHPVEEAALFAGRTDQMRRIIDGIFQAGQHIVVYGDRGVGKTSLTNVMIKKVFTQPGRVRFFTARCYEDDDFIKVWERVLGEVEWQDGDRSDGDVTDDPDSILALVKRLEPATSPVFIFDEFDRVTDEESKLRMAETIKLLSDRSEKTTVIIAGVGRTIRELIAEHKSTQRAIKQVQMPRMSEDEIKDIITVRLKRAGMTYDPHALDIIVWLARGMPGYAHLLGLHSSRSAIDRRDLRVNATDVGNGCETCIEDVSESTKHAYLRAVQSSQSNKLRHTLAACATVKDYDEFGAFHAGAVREPLSKILEEKREIPDFNRHLKAFCKERGPLLERDGQPKNYKYRFIDPMMQSYIMIEAYRTGLLR
jgi:Cdc6-like AAA superfamily ATPase